MANQDRKCLPQQRLYLFNTGDRCYNTTLRNLIPLPDPNAEIGSPTHPLSYETFQIGATVMAQYPDTTTFYRAEVVQGPIAALQANGKVMSSPIKCAACFMTRDCL